MESTTATETRRVAIGRFTLAVPAAWQLDEVGFTVRDTEIQEVPWPGTGERLDEQADRLWLRRLAEIRQIDYGWPAHVDSVIVEERALGPGVRGVLFQGAYLHTYLHWLLLLQTEEAAVWFEKEFPAETAEEALEEVRSLVARYQVGQPLFVDERAHFALRAGHLRLPPDGQEQLFARFTSPAGATMTIKSRTTNTPKEPDGFWSPGSFLSRGARLLGFRSDVVRAQEREVAGLRGKEEILHLEDEGREVLRGFWLYPGQKASALEPRMEVELKAPLKLDEAAVLADWDAFLDSMRRGGEAEE